MEKSCNSHATVMNDLNHSTEAIIKNACKKVLLRNLSICRESKSRITKICYYRCLSQRRSLQNACKTIGQKYLERLLHQSILCIELHKIDI